MTITHTPPKPLVEIVDDLAKYFSKYIKDSSLKMSDEGSI